MKQLQAKINNRSTRLPTETVSTVIGGSCCLKASFVLNSSADEFGLLRQAGSTRL